MDSQRGNGEVKPYRVVLDHLKMNDVCWRLYEGHREIQKFEVIF
ncbi:hypothetical protein MtrunA17_Chr1g0177431 [Medicago truncatula]|uniref:Uncharacterized protein n=1 Tax=Medicago truncatula TaxID=3880 RepID=A0A396JMF2_MEDTR|nr:hypothetical protein MtrunA17_Chr1g0177431 [Medicago truncatula]